MAVKRQPLSRLFCALQGALTMKFEVFGMVLCKSRDWVAFEVTLSPSRPTIPLCEKPGFTGSPSNINAGLRFKTSSK
jgi:hypothetical protein